MSQTHSIKPGKTNCLFDRSVSLLCWAYNEEDSIAEYMERASVLLGSVVFDYEIVLIDDGSTDNTYEIAKNFQQKNEKLKIYRNEKNLNVGPSFIRAIRMASKEFLFWQTIDWSYDISNLRVFLEYLKTFDVVQGVRRTAVEVRLGFLKPIAGLLKLFGVKHITKRSDTISKALVSIINYILIRTLFRIPCSDFQNVSFYPTKWVKSINMEAASSFANPELLIKSYWNGKTIKEVPINFIPRSKGQAKGTKPKAIMNSVRDVFGFWFKWVILGGRGHIKKGSIQRLTPKKIE